MRRILILTTLLLLAVPATASAQATRTWISGVGDDANPCSRTAPCKTWAGAQSKTANGGEINAIDQGAFGTVSVTKSLTLDGNSHQTGISTCGQPYGINVAAPTTARVTLRDIRISGCRNTGSPSTNGVTVSSVGTLRLDNLRIYGFSNAGVSLEPNHLKSRVFIQDSSIHDNGAYGVFARSAAGGNLRLAVSDSRLDDNGNGLLASSPFGPVRVRLFDSVITDNGQDASTGFGVWSAGADSTVRVGDSRITGNLRGLNASNGASLISYGGNIVDDNGNDGLFTGSVARK